MTRLSQIERERTIDMFHTGMSEKDGKKWKFEYLKVDPCVKSLTLKRKRWLTPSNPRNSISKMMSWLTNFIQVLNFQ